MFFSKQKSRLQKLTKRSGKNTVQSRRARLFASVERLEARLNMTSILYLDFGDSFPVDGLDTTVGDLRADLAANSGLNGPDLRVFDNMNVQTDYFDTLGLNFRPMSTLVAYDYNNSGIIDNQDYLDLRDNVISLVTRYYGNLDVSVQLAPALDGSTDATYLQGVRDTINGGDNTTGNRDAWVFVADIIRTDTNASVGSEQSLNGIAGGDDLGGNNDEDDSALVFADNAMSFNVTDDTRLGYTAAHEAGHTFGQIHRNNGNTGNLALNADVALLTGSELMTGSAGDTNRTNFVFNTRYPLYRGDGNVGGMFNPADVINQYNNLADSNKLGIAGASEFVTGTGAHDIISITRIDATTATVTVTAYRDTAHTDAIDVPGAAPGTTAFSYVINTTGEIIVQGGFGDDVFQIDATIITNFTVNGMANSSDQLIVVANGVTDISYSSYIANTVGLDGNTYMGGDIFSSNGLAIAFDEFTNTGSILVQGFVNVTYTSPGNYVDVVNLAMITGGIELSGTTDGDFIVPMRIDTATTLLIDVTALVDNLTMEAAIAGFAAITYNAGSGSDAISVTGDNNYVLTDSSLQVVGVGTVALIGAEIANLTGGASSNDFNVSGWTGTGSLTGGGGINDEVIATRASSTFTLSSFLTTTGFGALSLNGISVATLTGDGSPTTFNVSDWGGTGSLDGAGGIDIVNATKNQDFILTNTSLSASNGMSLALTSIEIANLTGGPSANNFVVSGWTGTGSLDGAGGSNSVTAAKDANFLLTNSLLVTTDGLSMTLTDITNAILTGGASQNSFTVTDWTGTGSIDGAGNDDTVISVKNFNYVLTDSSLTRTDGMSLTLANVEVANLTGGGNSNTFDISGWTGTGTLDGAGNVNDTIISTRNADIVLSNSLITASDGLVMNVANMENVNLTGGASANAFDVGGWTKKGTINGLGGSDTFISAKNVDYTATDALVTSTDGMSFVISSIENINLTGGATANNFFITPSATAVFNIAGLTPGFGGPTFDKLKINFTGTTGKHLVYSGPPLGNGYWEFANRLNVNFTSIEDLGFEGNVTAAKSGATLTLTGDALNNGVSVTNGPNNTVVVTGLGTKINGGTAQVSFSGVINVIANMNDGDDFIQFNNLNLYSITVNGGKGDDAFQTGSGIVPDFNNPMSVADAIASGSMAVRNALTYIDDKGNDSVFLTRTFGSATVANWNINTGEGADSVKGVWTSSKALTVNTGSGDDIVSFDRHTATDVALIDGVTGNDKLTLTNGDYAKDAKIYGGSGSDRINVDTNLLRASLFIDSGSESDTVFVAGNSVTKDLTVYTGHGYDTIFIGKDSLGASKANTAKKFTLDSGSEADFVSFGPNSFTDFFASLGSGDDYLAFNDPISITNKGTVDGGANKARIYKVGNPNVNYLNVTFV